jgi:hypothetical protein
MLIVGSVILFIVIAASLKLGRVGLGPSAVIAATLFGVFVGYSSESYQVGIGAFLVTTVLFW